ncbi:hypothetical protein C1645_822133 [Glomus cerebriforme]|uniref:Uncharacterized protein n=1 Tax=Glomus cerebriforme TaxID=658196 RepID=A0A397T369_9GLOM|nr:hypothetical protein C1645_822133 [Glomus cerebriforme]
MSIKGMVVQMYKLAREDEDTTSEDEDKVEDRKSCDSDEDGGEDDKISSGEDDYNQVEFLKTKIINLQDELLCTQKEITTYQKLTIYLNIDDHKE